VYRSGSIGYRKDDHRPLKRFYSMLIEDGRFSECEPVSAVQANPTRLIHERLKASQYQRFTEISP